MDRVQSDEPGPMTANVHGYKPMGEEDSPHRQRDPNGVITITNWFGESPDDKWGPGDTQQQWEARSNEKFMREAREIYYVLSNNLPGGTMHQLLIQMLQGKLNLFVVSDNPHMLPDRLNIEKLALDFVHSSDNWASYVDCKDSESKSLPPEWFLLCSGIEAKYGEPKVEIEPPSAAVAALIRDFEAGVKFVDEDGREITQVMASSELPEWLLVQVNHDNSEWYLDQPETLIRVSKE